MEERKEDQGNQVEFMIGIEKFDQPDGAIGGAQIKVVGRNGIKDIGADEWIEVEAT